MPKSYLSEWERRKDKAIERLITWAKGEKKRQRITDEDLAEGYGITRSAWSRKLREPSIDFVDFVYLVYRLHPDEDTIRHIIGE